MRTFIENYLHFMKNCIRPHYEKLKPLKSGFIENSNFENNRDPCNHMHAGFKPVARTAARMREALDVALEADKAEENVLPPLWSPWPTVLEGGADAVANVDQGMSAPLLVK